LFLTWLWIYRGSPVVVMRHFGDLGMYYNSFAALGRDVRLERAVRIRGFLRETAWLWATGLPGVAWLLFSGRQQLVAKGAAILLLLAPLPDIFGRPVFYHSCAQILLGIVFLGAMGLSWIRTFERSLLGRRVVIVVLLALAWLVGELDGRSVFRTYRAQFRLSRAFAPVMVWGRWDDRSVDDSFFLTAAKFIRDRTNPDDRIVTSGHLSSLYLLSNRLPPSPYLPDLVLMSCMDYPSRRPDLMEEIRRHPPRIVVENLDYPVKLYDYWPDFQSRYQLMTKIEFVSASVDYYRAAIWELRDDDRAHDDSSKRPTG
jgi:hypothetical protein